MARPCTICAHPRRSEIDKSLAGGESAHKLALELGLPQTTLYRLRQNCAGLKNTPRAEQIERSRGTVALASLPSRDELGSMYRALGERIDGIVHQAEIAGSLAVAVQGLNSLRQTFDSVGRLAGHDAPSVAVNLTFDAEALAAKLVEAMVDHGRRIAAILELEGVVCDESP